MMLLVALTGKDGIVLAADSRGTFGDPRGVTAQNDAQEKLHILAKHVAVMIAGSGEVGSVVIDIAKKEAEGNGLDWASPVMEALRATSRKQYQEWSPSVPAIQAPQLAQTGQGAVRPDLAFIVSGYEEDGSPKIFGLGSFMDFSPALHQYGFAVQGVAQYALYLLNRLYESERTVSDLTPLAVYAITETASQDGKVGGPVSVVTIRPGAVGCERLSDATVTEIQSVNVARQDALKNS